MQARSNGLVDHAAVPADTYMRAVGDTDAAVVRTPPRIRHGKQWELREAICLLDMRDNGDVYATCTPLPSSHNISGPRRAQMGARGTGPRMGLRHLILTNKCNHAAPPGWSAT